MKPKVLQDIFQQLWSLQRKVLHFSRASLYIAVVMFPFSHHVNPSRCCLQTWTLAGVHLLTRASRRAWKLATSARETGAGSGLIIAADKEAFAMAREWEAMVARKGLVATIRDLGHS